MGGGGLAELGPPSELSRARTTDVDMTDGDAVAADWKIQERRPKRRSPPPRSPAVRESTRSAVGADHWKAAARTQEPSPLPPPAVKDRAGKN